MNLENFIKHTLVEILNGIKTANNEIVGDNPTPETKKPFLLCPGSSSEHGSGIDFDVAITAKSEGKGKAGAKVRLAVVEAELGGDGGIFRESVSRVKFKVMVNQYHG